MITFMNYTNLRRIPWISLCEKNLTLSLKFLFKWGLRLTRFLIRIKINIINTPTSLSQSIKTIFMQNISRLLFV